MARRRRLGVAIVLEPPLADEVNGLRRALGDGSLGRIPPHLTLVPPVNVPAAGLGAALAAVRRAAASATRLRLTLGPVASFAPASPVVYLDVGGALEGLRALRDAVFTPPLARSLTWPWVPHVTVADEASPERVAAAIAALDRYAAVADIDRVVLLEELGQRWRPVADATLGGRSVVGTGGLPVELTRGRLVDPEGLAVLERVGAACLAGPVTDGRDSVVVSAHREGGLVGVGRAWVDAGGGHLAVVVDPANRGQGVGRHVLAALEAAVADAGWPLSALEPLGPPGFYRSA